VLFGVIHFAFCFIFFTGLTVDLKILKFGFLIRMCHALIDKSCIIYWPYLDERSLPSPKPDQNTVT